MTAVDPEPRPGQEEPPRGGRAFGAFRHRDFQLFWSGSVISNVGGWMQQLAQGWLVYELTGSVFLVGLNGLFHAVPFVLMSFYAGTVVDRVDRKRLLIWVEAFNAAVVIIVGALVATGQIHIWHIYASSVAHSLAGAFESPTRHALVRHMVPPEDLMTAVSLNSIVRKGAQIIGPALGGVFVAAFGVAGTYFIHAGSYGVLLLCLILMRAPNPNAGRVIASPLQAIVDGLTYARAQTVIGALILMEATMSAFGSYHAMMVIFAKDIFEMGPEGLGILQSAAGAGSLVGSFGLACFGDVRYKGRLLIGTGVVYGLALVAFAFCPWYLLALPILAAVGAADIVFGATRTTMLQLLVRSDMLGRVMSLSAISMRGVGHLGSFQMGSLAAVAGVQGAVALGAVAVIVLTVAAGWWVPGVRDYTGEGGREDASRPARVHA